MRSAGEWVRGRGGAEADDAGWMGGGPFWGAGLGFGKSMSNVSEYVDSLGPKKSVHLFVLTNNIPTGKYRLFLGALGCCMQAGWGAPPIPLVAAPADQSPLKRETCSAKIITERLALQRPPSWVLASPGKTTGRAATALSWEGPLWPVLLVAKEEDKPRMGGMAWQAASWYRVLPPSGIHRTGLRIDEF